MSRGIFLLVPLKSGNEMLVNLDHVVLIRHVAGGGVAIETTIDNGESYYLVKGTLEEWARQIQEATWPRPPASASAPSPAPASPPPGAIGPAPSPP